MQKRGVVGSARSVNHTTNAQSSRKYGEYIEYQLKFPTTLTEIDILASGAKRLGSVIHEDRYFLQPKSVTLYGPGLVRVRKENGDALNYSYKKELPLGPEGAKGAVVSTLADADADLIKKNYTHILDVNKRRVIYVLGPVVINYDVVDPLGTYVELVVAREKDYEKLIAVAKKLKLPLHQATSQTYFQLAYTKTDTMQVLLSSLVSKLGRFSFGIASGVLTTLGIIIVLDTSTISRVAIIAGIVAVAVADSMSDAFGVYSLKKSERGTSQKNAIGAAFATFLGKVFCATTFIIPFLMTPIDVAVKISILWGIILLVLVNFEIAVIQRESIWKTIVLNVFLAMLVMVISYYAGSYLAFFN